ncbi:hypothetical protein EKK58_03540 [Candidatus Dependentiae bacterium]|nr:MAG: hypothetical protein EKK58_03540 [Candidatus Dependentiae bacterium]
MIVYGKSILAMESQVLCNTAFIKKIDSNETISALANVAKKGTWTSLKTDNLKNASVEDIVLYTISVFFSELKKETTFVSNKKDLCFLFDMRLPESQLQSYSSCFMFLTGCFTFYQSNKNITDSFINSINNFFDCIENEDQCKNAKIYTMWRIASQQRDKDALYTFWDSHKKQAFIYFHQEYYDNSFSEENSNQDITRKYCRLYNNHLTDESFPYQCHESYERVALQKMRSENITNQNDKKQVSIYFSIVNSNLLYCYQHGYLANGDEIVKNGGVNILTTDNIVSVPEYTISVKQKANIEKSFETSNKTEDDLAAEQSRLSQSMVKPLEKDTQKDLEAINKLVITENTQITKSLSEKNKKAKRKKEELERAIEELKKANEKELEKPREELKKAREELKKANEKIDTLKLYIKGNFVFCALLISFIFYQQYKINALQQGALI